MAMDDLTDVNASMAQFRFVEKHSQCPVMQG